MFSGFFLFSYKKFNSNPYRFLVEYYYIKL